MSFSLECLGAMQSPIGMNVPMQSGASQEALPSLCFISTFCAGGNQGTEQRADLPMVIQLITGKRLIRGYRQHWSFIQRKIQGTEASLPLASNQYIIRAFMLRLEAR